MGWENGRRNGEARGSRVVDPEVVVCDVGKVNFKVYLEKLPMKEYTLK